MPSINTTKMENPLRYNEVIDALERLIARHRYKEQFSKTREVRNENKAKADFHESILHYLKLRNHAKG
jgi:hypothetical protein